MNKWFAWAAVLVFNLYCAAAFAQSYPSIGQPDMNPWQDRSSSPTRRGAVPSSYNVYGSVPFSGDYAATAGLAELSVSAKPIPSGKFNLGFGGSNYFQPNPNSSGCAGGDPVGNGGGDQQEVTLPYTPGPDWAAVYNSHSGSLMGYMAPGETLQQFFSGESGHILPSQAAEGQWILQNQLGGMSGETASQFSGF